MPAFTVETRAFRAGDEALLMAGIERAGRSGAGVRRDQAELRWRYGAAPHGALVSLALSASGEPIAGISATRQRVRFQDGEVFWLEVGDLFNDFGAGSGLSRAAPLIAAGKAFAETHGGFAPEGHPIMYGLPDRRAHRLGLRSLGWEVLRSESELVLDLGRAPGSSGDEVKVEVVERFSAEVERIFESVAEGRGALLVRDERYLNWRYVERPGEPFALAVARRSGQPVGLAALRGGLLYEWCVCPEDEPAVAALLAWACGHCTSEGRLRAVFPDSAPEWLLFQKHGFRVTGTQEYLCFRSFQRPAIMSWMFHNWSYSRGDTLR